jgi:hypothetical protein
MSFREKIAWLSLFSMAVAYGPYFSMAVAHEGDGLPNVRLLWMFGLATVARGTILGIGYAVLRRLSVEDARVPVDERDRAIDSRAVSWAYWVMMAGMVAVGCLMPFNSGGWKIVNAALFMIVAAEVVRYGVVVTCYRRQA